MTKRIFRSIIIVALAVFLSSIIIFAGVLYDYFSNVSKNQLKIQTELAAEGVESEGIGFFSRLNTDSYRITWIAADGSVLFDSSSDSSGMENHLEREEIKQALTDGYGESARYSSTRMERSLYSAKLLKDGTVLRLSISQNTIIVLLLGMAQPLCIVIAIAIILALLLASRLSKRIVKPLNDIDLDEPLHNDGYEELTPFLNRIAQQQDEIRCQSDELKRKQLQFEAVTEGMREGIVLLSDQGCILSLNRAAEKILEVEDYSIGEDILSLHHSGELQNVLQKAQMGIPYETKVEISDIEYQLHASPVKTQDGICGIVLLIFDITEKEKAEQMRREFTANVSHELKTPLHTISGCAELLKNNMVASADIPSFYDKIYAESGRMITLVEDIIRLSHLDEGAQDLQRDTVDLFEIAENTVRNLIPVAENAGVSIDLSGVPAKLYGITQLLEAIVFNLCDNAIKYNVHGGSVSVNVRNDNENIILTVSDTGIGISSEHQERIFERFYRVDKSRSKEVGGTGLGLSIVKHAAKLHNASIAVDSIVNAGTSISVSFPKGK